MATAATHNYAQTAPLSAQPRTADIPDLIRRALATPIPPLGENYKLELQVGDILESRETGAKYVVALAHNETYSLVDFNNSTLIPFNMGTKLTKTALEQKYIVQKAASFLMEQNKMNRKNKLLSYILRSDHCNVQICTAENREQKIYAFKAVLMQFCTYFQQGFADNKWPARNGIYEIEVPPNDFNALQILVNFIHECTYTLRNDEFHDYLRIAEFYGCSFFLDVLVKLLPRILTLSNLAHYIQFINNPKLNTIIFQFMKENWTEIKEKHFHIYESLTRQQCANFFSYAFNGLQTQTNEERAVKRQRI